MPCEYHGIKSKIDPDGLPEMGERRAIYDNLPHQYCSIDAKYCNKPNTKCWKRKGFNWDKGSEVASFNQELD